MHSNPIPLENIFGKEFIQEFERLTKAMDKNIADLIEMGYLDAESDKGSNNDTKRNIQDDKTMDKEE